MTNIWFISDTHFFHANMLKFLREDGVTRGRHEFGSVEEMNEAIVSNWNSVVGVSDHIYHLGDVTFRYDGAFNELMSRLKGHKRLVVGNHDKLKNPSLFRWFDKVMLWRGFKEHNFTATHIPLRLDSLRDGAFNVHGHIHHRLMDDLHYINVSVERIHYRPIHLEEITKLIRSYDD